MKPKAPISGVEASRPSLVRHSRRSASGIQLPWGMLATGPAKPPSRISSTMNWLWTMTPRAAVEDAAGHLDAVVIGADFEGADALREFDIARRAVEDHLGHVGVPIAAADGVVGDEVVQVGLVHHHDAGTPQGGFVDESVEGIVADLIDVDVELRRVVELSGRIEDGDVDELFEFGDEGGGIVRDAALGRRHGRPESATSEVSRMSADQLQRESAERERAADQERRARGVAGEEDFEMRFGSGTFDGAVDLVAADVLLIARVVIFRPS